MLIFLLVLAVMGRPAFGADPFLAEEAKARQAAVKADRDGRLDEAIQELTKAIDFRMRGSRVPQPDDQRLLQQLRDEKTLRVRAKEMEDGSRIDAAAATVEELILVRGRRLGAQGVPDSAADRNWLTNLQNLQTEQWTTGYDVAREYQDRWFDRRLEFHSGGRLADELNKKESELKELLKSRDENDPACIRLKDAIAADRKDLDAKLNRMKDLAAAQREAYKKGDLTNAAVDARMVLDLRRDVYGPKDLTVGIGAAEAARIEINNGQLFSLATKLLDEAASVFQSIYGEKHWRVRDVEIQTRELKELRSTFPDVVKRAPQIRANIEHGLVLMQKGKFRDAEEAARSDLEFLDFYAPDRPLTLTARTLINLASALRTSGGYTDAIPVQSRAIRLIRDLYGEEHPEMVSSLNNQATTYYLLGDYGQAHFINRQASELCGIVWGKDRIEYAACLTSDAQVLTELGRLDEARPLVVQALKIAETDFKRYGGEWTQSFRILAEIEFRLGRWENARNYYAHAVKNMAANPGKSHPDYVATLGRYAIAEYKFGQFEQAEKLFLEAAALSERNPGKTHPDHAALLASFARMYEDHGEFAKSAVLLDTALTISRQHLDSTFAVLSERQQLTMTENVSSMLSDYIAVANRSARSPREIYSHAVAWKGAVIAGQQRTRASAKDPETTALRTRLDDLSRRLAGLVLSVPDPAQKDGRDKLINELTIEKDRLEGELTSRGIKSLRPKSATLGQIHEALPAGTALVDVYQYRDIVAIAGTNDLRYQARLTAFVIPSGQPIIQVDLGPVAPIEQNSEKWRQAIVRGGGGIARGLALLPQAQNTVAEPQKELRRFLWEPIEKRLETNTIVLFSPDGVVSNLPLAALPGSKPGRYLIEERGIVQVPSPSLLPDLLAEALPGRANHSVLLIGDVDFAALPGTSPGAPRDVAKSDRSITRSGDLTFQPLPGTERETTRIHELHVQLFQESQRRLLNRATATEAGFREFAPSSRVLHVATHGFFGDQSDLSRPATQSKGEADDTTLVRRMHPGLSSGIALTGANRGSARADDDEITDDGILTALEVAALDLSVTEMAVLSACETGLGTSAGGEGLLSLQRAFQVAGVKSTVTSLWKVDDAATQILMVEFYRNLWEKRLGNLESLRRAQLTMLEAYDPGNKSLRDRGLKLLDKPAGDEGEKRLSPYFWAAFTLSGDWR